MSRNLSDELDDDMLDVAVMAAVTWYAENDHSSEEDSDSQDSGAESQFTPRPDSAASSDMSVDMSESKAPIARARKTIVPVVAPYHNGHRSLAVGAGPAKLRSAGLLAFLRDAGLRVSQNALELDEQRITEQDGEISASFEAIGQVADHVADVVTSGGFPLVLAGNCYAETGTAAGIFQAHAASAEDVGVIWFDAHTDLDTPEETESGYLDGQASAIMVGQAWRTLTESVPGYKPIRLEDVTYVGVRDLSAGQWRKLHDSDARFVPDSANAKVDFASDLCKLLDQQCPKRCIVHLDVDCLDTSIGRANKYAAPGGLSEQDLVDCLLQVATRCDVLSLTIASFDPSFEGADELAGVVTRCVTGFLRQVIAGR